MPPLPLGEGWGEGGWEGPTDSCDRILKGKAL
jgi:hypothetical protein